MRDAYDHAEYVGKDIARYEQARQVFKGTQPGYGEWQLVTNENGHDGFAVRILSRSEVPQARGVWCLADHYRRTGDHLLAGGYRVYLGLWDEGRERVVLVPFSEAMAIAEKRIGRGSGRTRAPDYYEFPWELG